MYESELIHSKENTQLGPSVTTETRCSGCRHDCFTTYAVQGDSGSHHYCSHPLAQNESSHLVSGETVRSHGWNTPEWCPELKAQNSQLAETQAQLKEAREALKLIALSPSEHPAFAKYGPDYASAYEEIAQEVLSRPADYSALDAAIEPYRLDAERYKWYGI